MTKKIQLTPKDIETECDFSHSRSLFMEPHTARVRVSFDITSIFGDGQMVRREVNKLIEEIEKLVKNAENDGLEED